MRRVLLPLLNNDEAKLRVDALNGKLSVPTGALAETELVAAVADTGMRASPWSEESGGISCACCGDEEPAPASGSWRGRLREILTLAGGFLMIAAFVAHLSSQGWQAVLAGEELPLPALLLYLGAVAAGFSQVLPRAWRSLRQLNPDMNLLMSLAVIGALVLGEYFEAAMVSFLFSFSLLLESWSVGRARKAIARLMEIAPDEARVVEDGGEQMRPVEAVALGARIRVHPGERIPLDGFVRAGAAAVDQSPITGESQPVAKETGDEVFAGCINGEGVLEIEVSHLARESTLARIMLQVEEAQGRRAAAERWVDRFARVYTPIMMGIALAIALLPPLFFGGSWERWFYQALVILVIACPCALVISTPVSVVAGLARAAREGVLIKGGIFLELPSRLAAMAFDKTGTLSRGKAQLEFIHCVDGVEENELLAEAAALEARSGHPLAAAVLAATRERGLAVESAEALKVIPGKGLQGEVAGRSRWIGSRRYMLELGREVDGLAAEAATLESQGHTLLLLADDTRVRGLIAVRDGLRPEAPAALAELASLGIEQQVVLTGDHAHVAEALLAELRSEGANPEIRAELLPEDKSAAVEAIREAHGCVAMVGDGINDAPALATADIGIAMGVMGADAAIETADVALMSEDLGRLPWLIRHSGRVMGIIRQNIALALLIKAAFMVLAVTNVATLWMAIVADMGGSLLVIGNGLRLLRAPGVDSKR